MHIAYVMTENDDKQMRSYDSFFPALKNLHISTPNSFSRGSGGYENLYGTNGRQSFFFKSHAHKFWLNITFLKLKFSFVTLFYQIFANISY